MPKLRALLLSAAGLLLAFTTFAAAQDYPVKPVRIIVAFSPGGINDTIARLVAAQLSERLGKQFIVENKPGAGGVIAGEALVNAPNDGHTLLVVSLAIAVNLTDLEATSRAMNGIRAKTDRIDALLNIAGGYVWEPLDEGAIGTWERMFALNVKTALTATKAALPRTSAPGRLSCRLRSSRPASKCCARSPRIAASSPSSTRTSGASS